MKTKAKNVISNSPTLKSKAKERLRQRIEQEEEKRYNRNGEISNRGISNRGAQR